MLILVLNPVYFYRVLTVLQYPLVKYRPFDMDYVKRGSFYGALTSS